MTTLVTIKDLEDVQDIIDSLQDEIDGYVEKVEGAERAIAILEEKNEALTDLIEQMVEHVKDLEYKSKVVIRGR